jgi:hypothetical protein
MNIAKYKPYILPYALRLTGLHTHYTGGEEDGSNSKGSTEGNSEGNEEKEEEIKHF